ncbi:MAG: DUF6747 family protein [Bacteroidota bacterium]
MENILLIKKIYEQAFRNLGNYLLRNGIKVYFWVCIFLYGVVLYAFGYRLIDGFVWD